MHIFTEHITQTGINTILIPVLLIFIGLIIEILNSVITNTIASATSPKIAFFVRNYLTYLGTVHHELAHALFAFISGAKITNITLVPKGNKLGSVQLVTRGNFFMKGIQLSLSASAPVICGAGTLYAISHFLFPYCSEWWHYVIFIYLFVSILFHMNMSTQDVKNFIKGLFPCLVIIFVIMYFINPDIIGTFKNLIGFR